MHPKSIALAASILALGFIAGWLASPKPVKASGMYRVWHSNGSGVVPSVYGTPISISCPVEDSCYVLTGGD